MVRKSLFRPGQVLLTKGSPWWKPGMRVVFDRYFYNHPGHNLCRAKVPADWKRFATDHYKTDFVDDIVFKSAELLAECPKRERRPK